MLSFILGVFVGWLVTTIYRNLDADKRDDARERGEDR
jgi:hypothetical protein